MEWYYADAEQKQAGPFSDSEIKILISNGTVQKSTMVWNESMAGWLPVQETPLNNLTSRNVPPPLSSVSSMPSAPKANEPLTTWSLVLGIISLLGCGFFASIPAVICGHLGLSKIKRNPSLGGRGKAIAGLITGYLSIVLIAIIATLATFGLPGIEYGLERAKTEEALSSMKQCHLAIEQVALDAITTGDKSIGWPADAQLKSKADLKNMLVPSYFNDGDYEHLNFDKMSIGNISESDPGDTIILRYKTENGSILTMLKDGRFGLLPSPKIAHAQVKHWKKKTNSFEFLEVGQTFGNPPPRTPAFLE